METEVSPFLSPLAVPVPVGLSDKELAQLRLSGLHSSPGAGREPSDTAPANTDGGTLGDAEAEVATSSGALRLRTEVNLLRHEVQQLRAERLPEERTSEAPPTYSSRVDGDA